MTRILIALALVAVAWAADPTYSDVQPLVEQTIKLVEAKDADGVFNLCIVPKELEKIKADAAKFAELKKDFLAGKAADFLATLKLVATSTATWDATAATLKFASKDMEHDITFLLIEKRWYIKD